MPEISLESLLEINTIRTATEEMAVRVAAAGKITPDRERAADALIDEFPAGAGKWRYGENSFGQPRVPL